jgi:outer membrane protein assembly factor BamB
MNFDVSSGQISGIPTQELATKTFYVRGYIEDCTDSNNRLSTSEPVTIQIKVKLPPEIINFDISANGVRQSNEKITRSIFVEGERCDAVSIYVTDSSAIPTTDDIVNCKGLSHNGTSKTFNITDLIEDTSYNAHTVSFTKTLQFEQNSVITEGKTGGEQTRGFDYNGIDRMVVQFGYGFKIYKYNNNSCSWNEVYHKTLSRYNPRVGLLKMHGDYIVCAEADGSQKSLNIYKWRDIDNSGTLTDISKITFSGDMLKNTSDSPATAFYFRGIVIKNNKVAVSFITDHPIRGSVINVYEISNNNITQVGNSIYNKRPNPSSNLYPRIKFDMDNDLIALGIATDGDEVDGEIRIFKYNNTNNKWENKDTITEPSISHFMFGCDSISLSGTTLATKYVESGNLPPGTYTNGFTHPLNLVIYELNSDGTYDSTQTPKKEFTDINNNTSIVLSIYKNNINIYKNILAVIIAGTADSVLQIYKKNASGSWDDSPQTFTLDRQTNNLIIAEEKIAISNHDEAIIYSLSTDVISDISSQTFRTMLPRPTFTYPIPISLKKLALITSPIGPTDTGINTIVSYEISPAIDNSTNGIPGLTFDASGEISGTPQIKPDTDLSFSVIATAADGQVSLPVDFTIEIVLPDPPTLEPYNFNLYEDYIVIGSDDHSLYAFNAADGSKKWSYETGAWVSSSPAVSSDGATVFVGSSDDKLYAINTADGTKKWEFLTGDNVSTTPTLSSDGATVFVGSDDDKFYAFNTADGSKKWEFLTGGNVASSPALSSDDAIVFVGSRDKKLYAIYTANGNKKWEFVTGSRVDSSPVLSSDGATVFVGSGDKKLYAINTADGSKKWEFLTGGQVQSTPVLNSDENIVFVGSQDKKLYAINTGDGTKKWEFETGDWILKSSPVLSSDDNTVFVASWDRKLYAINTADGTKKWEFVIGGTPSSTPLFSSDGKILFIGSGRSFYAINADNGTVVDDWGPDGYGYYLVGGIIGTSARFFQSGYYSYIKCEEISATDASNNIPRQLDISTQDAIVRYEINPDISTYPALSFDPSNGKIIGIPKEDMNFSVTGYTQDDQSSNSVPLTIKVELPPAPVLNGYIDPSAVLTIGRC